MLLLSWFRAFLILIPLGIAGISIYWVVLVTEPIFIAACGAGDLALGLLSVVSAVLSSFFVFFAFKELPRIRYSSITFHGFFISTAVGLLIAGIAMVATSPESQKVCTGQIATYLHSHEDDKTADFLKRHDSDYDQLVYSFAFGQTSHEAFFILTTAWLGSVIAFFALVELV
jgi:hypothetical protein